MSEISGWVPQPNCGRGTLDILLECIFTILFAIWGTQHPDVPSSSLWSRIKVSMIFLLFPKLSALYAMQDLIKALSLLSAMRQYGNSWTLKQSFAIIMSAVYVAYPEAADLSPRSRANDGWLVWCSKKAHLKSESHDEIGKPTKRGRRKLNLGSEHERLETILPPSVTKRLPNKKDLDKRSAAEGFAKLLALIQALGFLLRNVVSRLVKDMDISLLEVSTLGHLLCAVISSLAWHQKPQNLAAEIVIDITDREATTMKTSRQRDTNRNRRMPHARFVLLQVALVCCITSIYLGLTWTTPFPSLTETWLWRGTVLACAVLGIALQVLRIVSRNSVWTLVIAILCGLCRLAIMEQSIAALKAAPSDICLKPAWAWTDYWPSFKL